MKQDNKLSLFEGKPIRKIWQDEQWFFSIIDIIEILTESPTPRKYWDKVKRKLKEEGINETSPIWRQFKLMASDDKLRLTDCANTEGVLRIIMSVPSPKAEPFKQWMAQVSKERIEETENPEIGFDRLREIYKAKGYPDDWIGYREKSILIRKELTDEWKKRDVSQNTEFSILTAEISKATFGLTPGEHKNLKGLDRQNLRDHMTNFELILTALSEEATRHIAVRDDAQGFEENREAAVKGGNIAGKARRNLEKDLGESVVSNKNYLNLGQENNKELPSEKGEEE